jgi:fumarate reductase (CoM/CoB) subunit B
MKISSLFKRITGNVLFYPGCFTKEFAKKEFDNYKELLNKFNIKYILMKKESCCALPLIQAGYKTESKQIAENNLKLFKEKKIYKIITSCPSCYYTFKEKYPKLLKNWDIEVEFITDIIYKELKKRKIFIETNEIVSYHDPCYLGRYLNEFETPRKIITLLGGKIIEPIKTKEEALCCGGGVLFKSSYPDLSKKISKLRISHFDKSVTKIITPCTSCYINLLENDSRVTELSSFVLQKLRKVLK